jgi:hypothetical protein
MPHTQVAIVMGRAKMIRLIEKTTLQCIRNLVFDSGWQIWNVFICQPGILKLTDIEAELSCYVLEQFRGNKLVASRVLNVAQRTRAGLHPGIL